MYPTHPLKPQSPEYLFFAPFSLCSSKKYSSFYSWKTVQIAHGSRCYFKQGCSTGKAAAHRPRWHLKQGYVFNGKVVEVALTSLAVPLIINLRLQREEKEDDFFSCSIKH